MKLLKKSLVVVKFANPSILDKHPYKTVWKSCKNTEQSDVYIQLSIDDENPNWVRFGSILERLLEDEILHKDFIDQVIEIFEDHCEVIT